MKTRAIIVGLLCIALAGFNTGCKKKTGCTDRNGDNYNSDAETNTGCVYRYTTTVEVTGVPANNPAGSAWDSDNSGPDLRVNFGKSSSSVYDYTTNTSDNSYSASLNPTSTVMFTNEEWKYQLVDTDPLSADEVIASGTFNPVTGGSDLTLKTGDTKVTFKYATR